ncbi:glycine oxidase [Gracilibacillus ureilyticus]|uniref:glycine oxidase n=1 Tax=Gracilibacillus ureilyticus TaxID=531814 RepID=A0A1H9SKP7_9BACI|nr:glycine oxidase ThiO [Gracilibacillus ureilyticus]SER85586.1 glycine oxidase [Gracilibacillus ureilyticus]
MNGHYDQIVVGGGVIGCSVAYQLSKRGYRVLLIEGDAIGSGASSAAAGMLGAQLEFSSDSILFQFARESRALFPELSKELKEVSGIDTGFIQKGVMKLASTEQQLIKLREIANFQRSAGESAIILSQKAVSLKERELAGDFLGGLFLPDDGQVSAPLLTKAFAKGAQENGAVLLENTPVTELLEQKNGLNGVKTTDSLFYCDQLVIATGSDSKWLPVDVSITPVKGECVSVRPDQPLIESTIYADGCYLVPKFDGRIIIGATSLPGMTDKRVRVKGVHHLLTRAQQILPALEYAQLEHFWAGIRPQTADGFPYIGKVPGKQGIYAATGHYRNGILLSPLTGIMMADLLEGKADKKYVTGFALDRKKHALV